VEKIVIIGLGEVGKAIYDIFVESQKFEVYGYDIDSSRTINRYEDIPRPIDVVHIAIPYSTKFIDIVKQYLIDFKPMYAIIHSTVAPTTTRRLYEEVKIPIAFSPVRGKHPNMKKHLRFWSKWVCSIPKELLDVVIQHLSTVGFKVKPYRGEPETLEVAKLWETVYRAIMIASWQELHRIARRFNADISTVAEFIGEVHEVLHDRPIYFPGYIGGHCLIPNTIILNSVYSSKLFEFVLESNEKRLKELEDVSIRHETEKLKEIFIRYTNYEYYT